jgi:UDP-N-acetyl-2-amino-2-deoxyglucuronate dehydrogenase
MKKINFLLIGTGQIAATHIAAIKSLPEANLAGIYSPSDYGRALALAQVHGVKAYKTLEGALGDEKIEAVDIVAKNFLHAPLGIKAAQYGKHVLTEKPMATTVNDADKLIAVCRKNKVKLSVIFQNRFAPVYLELREKIRHGKLGKVNLAVFSWMLKRDEKYFSSSPWRRSIKEAGGGFLMMNAIHYIDLLQWFLGPVSAVAAETGKFKYHKNGIEDTAWAGLRFKSGARAIIYGTTAASASQPPRLEIIGAKNSRVVADSRGIIASPSFFSAQINDFILAIRKNRQPAVDGKEGKKSLAIVAALYRSARMKKEISL